MNKSESIQNIAKALVGFQSEVKNPANTANNPFFKSKYAPLPEILNDIRPLLSKHGLSLLQSPSGDGDKIVITTLLMHESGEWIETCPLILKADKATAQGAGSAITYGRRYALSAVLGISSEDDDDGNQATKTVDKKTTTATAEETIKPLPTKPQNGELLSDAQRKKIYAMTTKISIKSEDVKKMMLQRYKVDDSKQLTKKQASDFIEFLGKLENGEEVWFADSEVPF